MKNKNRLDAARPETVRAASRLAILLLLSLTAGGAQALPESLTGRIVVDGITFAEGPAFDSDGTLYFVNYKRSGSIGRMKAGGAPDIWVDLPAGANAFGLKVDARGNIYAADFNSHKLFRVSPAGQVAIVTESYNGAPFHGLNDLCLDQAGNLYFTDPRGSGIRAPYGAVFRLSSAGDLTKVAGEIPFPNGIVVSPDQSKLYVSDTGTNSILVWDLARDGTVSHRRTFHQFADASVDGISFDDAGRLWVARLDHASLGVLSGEGELLKSYPVTLAGKVTNMAWWGHSLFVTTSVENVIRRFELPFGGAPAIPRKAR
jgi:sugar lactone lactonase YvrE